MHVGEGTQGSCRDLCMDVSFILVYNTHITFFFSIFDVLKLPSLLVFFFFKGMRELCKNSVYSLSVHMANKGELK